MLAHASCLSAGDLFSSGNDPSPEALHLPWVSSFLGQEIPVQKSTLRPLIRPALMWDSSEWT